MRPGWGSLDLLVDTNGGQIVGSGSSVRFDTSGLPPGNYVVTGTVRGSRGGSADCSAGIDAHAPTALELRLTLHSIYFPTAQPSSQNPEDGLLRSQSQTLIALAADFETYLQSKPDASLILEGHADPRGSVEYNQSLFEQRVDSTKRFLVAHGIPTEKIQTKAFGVQDNLTDEQVRSAVEDNSELSASERKKVLDNTATIILASNRRVDITLVRPGNNPFVNTRSMQRIRSLCSARGNSRTDAPETSGTWLAVCCAMLCSRIPIRTSLQGVLNEPLTASGADLSVLAKSGRDVCVKKKRFSVKQVWACCGSARGEVKPSRTK